jgi:hypothetical protein
MDHILMGPEQNMLRAILTSLALTSAMVAVVAWFIGFASAAKAFTFRGRQILSTEVNALQDPEVATAAERAEKFVPPLAAPYGEVHAGCPCRPRRLCGPHFVEGLGHGQKFLTGQERKAVSDSSAAA